MKRFLALTLLLTAPAYTLMFLRAAPAIAQMPDLRAMSGKPLPVGDLPAGTVTVRIARRMPSNAVADVEVTAIVANAAGEARKRVVKTGSDGRATFEGVGPGSTFQAEVTVDGERLKTSSFTVPSQGGTRIMLIAGLGAAGAAAGDAHPAGGTGAKESFSLGAVGGTVVPDGALATGTLEILLSTEDGQPIASREVKLGLVGGDNAVKVLRAVSDAQGLVRFTDLPAGEGGAAAVMEHDGMRFNTEPFRMPVSGGARGGIRVIGRTSDPSVLSVTQQSKIVIVEPLEDSVHIGESIVFSNGSEKIFDPGEEGLLIPLPKGVTSGRPATRGVKLEFKPNEGFLMKGTVPPNRAAVYATEAQGEFVVPGDGSGRVTFRQPMPWAMKTPLIMLPAASGMSVEAPGLRPLRDDADSQGNSVKLYELPDVPAGGAITLTISGLPRRETRGRSITAVLCATLIAGAVMAGRRAPKQARASGKSRDDLLDRREKLFAELLAFERTRRQRAGDTKEVERRRELVGKLEAVYQELARVEQEDSPAP